MCSVLLGHSGNAVVLNADNLSDDEKLAVDEGWKKYGHNEFVNRMISMRRTLPDVRDPA